MAGRCRRRRRRTYAVVVTPSEATSSDVRRRVWRTRIVSWWWWVAQPWRSAAASAALLGAFALPAVVLAASSQFEQSAADSIAEATAAALDPDQAGFTVSAAGFLQDDRLPDFDRVLVDHYRSIRPLGPVTRLLIADEFPVGVGDPDQDPGEIEIGSGSQGRLFARDGAIDSLDIVAGDRADPGAWISERLAGELGARPGDTLLVGSGSEPIPVAGIHRDLWAGDVSPWWDDVPSQYVPLFINAFNSPNFELIIVSDAALLAQGPVGRAEWHATLQSPPRTSGELAALTAAYSDLERRFIRDVELAVPYRRFAIDPEVVPFTSSTAFDALARTDRIRGELQNPLSTATVGGTVAGVVLSSLGAIFLIRRRNREYRLMAADGDGPLSFLGRALVQFAGPSVLGALLGAVVAWGLVLTIGPSGRADPTVIQWGSLAAASALALVLAAVVTAASAVRLADGLTAKVGEIRVSWLVFLLGTAGAMWIQVGREPARQAGPLVVGFPLVGILTGVIASVVALRAVLRSVRRSGSHLGTPLFLAWRALTASDIGALLVTTALGVATGLAVLSSLFVTSIDAAAEAKAVTVAGPANRVSVSGPFDADALPPGSTVIRTSIVPADGEQVTVLAIDPGTITDLSWPETFGHDPQWLVDTLAPRDTSAVPAVMIGGGTLAQEGEFGLVRRFPYRIVGTAASVPLAAERRPTLVVRQDVFESFARSRWEAGLERPGDGGDEDYESPLFGYRSDVLTSAPADDVSRAVDGTGARVMATTSLNQELSSVEVRATRWTFEFVQILAAIGALTAIGALALYLSERRADRMVSAVITQQIGIPAWVDKVAAVVELVGLVVVALAAGTVAATFTAGRVFPNFEPDPWVPPEVGLTAAPGAIAAVMALVVFSVVAVALLTQRAAGRAEKAKVMRGAG